jgi:hypothetical protein
LLRSLFSRSEATADFADGTDLIRKAGTQKIRMKLRQDLNGSLRKIL